MFVFIYPLALAFEWYFGAKLLGKWRALIPVLFTLCSRASFELFAGPLPIDYEILPLACLVIAAPIPVVFCLGRIGARISKVRRRLRPLLFGLWIITIWGGIALYVLRGFTLFYSA